jgi:uncharacterized protein (DUF362 family)
MNRREFLRQVSLWSAGMIMTPPVFDMVPELFASPPLTPEIFVANSMDYPGMTDKLIQAMGGIQTFIKKGDKVVIKPNIGWDRSIEQGANTHPQIISRLAELCLDAGASRVQVFDRTCNEERRCYHNSGMQAALEKIRDKRFGLEYMDDRKFVPVAIRNGQAIREWPFYKDALEADCYINVPVAKHHGLSRLTLGIKNIMGVVGGWRGRLHSGLETKLADLNTVIKPTLTLIDATRILLRNGPQGGNIKDVKQLDTLIGSRDPVAADAYATTLFGLIPADIASTVEAYQRGMGQMDLGLCRIHQVTA